MEKIIDEINHLDLFSDAEKKRLIDKLRKNDKGKTVVECLIRKTDIVLTPEEIVRQLYLDKLINNYKYPIDRIKVEYPIQMGSSSSKRADIVIFEEENPTTAYIIVELKNSKLQDGKKQLASYCHFTGAPMGVWTNGKKIAYFNRKDPNHIEEILNIPKNNQTLQDILNEPFTLKDLILKDKILNSRETLKDIIKGM